MAMSEIDKIKQRDYRARTKNLSTHNYERTRKGKLMRCYRNMKSRITGVQAAKYHLYKGKSLLGKDEFYSWSLSDDGFNKLFDEWVDSDFDRRLSPSVDRVDSTLGYQIGNMEWVTHSENSRRGTLSRFGKR